MSAQDTNISSELGADGKIYTTSAPSDNTGNSFRFPYSAAPELGVVKDVSDPSRNIYVTRISNSNPYYFTVASGGKSGAIAINNKSLINNSRDEKYSAIKRLKSGTTLANCVGWAHGRINEIWGTAVSTGYIEKQNGNWVIPSKNNELVLCGREPAANITPAGDAYTFYDRWPSSEGWTKTTRYTDDIRPCPGAIICWRNMASDNGLCGHVGVVEAVYNYGQTDEYIVVSMSGYSTTGAQKVVWLQTIKRSSYSNGAPFSYGSNYKFTGFLFSPVCQLLPVGGYYANRQQTYKDITVLEADKEKYSAISEALAATTNTNKDFVKSQKVKIVWFGSSTPDETDSRVNIIDGVGTIVSVNKSSAYPYAVSITEDGTVSGYFNREALKAV